MTRSSFPSGKRPLLDGNDLRFFFCQKISWKTKGLYMNLLFFEGKRKDSLFVDENDLMSHFLCDMSHKKVPGLSDDSCDRVCVTCSEYLEARKGGWS